MSTCLTLADFERFDAGLSDEATALTVRAHLDACDACRVAYEQYRQDQAFLANARTLMADDSESGEERGASASAAGGQAPGRVPRIEGYRITGVLGQGGMGIVYRAVQTKLKRTVALKVLPAMIGAASPSAVSRFRREATAAARLHHTHIVPIYDFGESHDAYYYAMELISGQPLNVVISKFAQHNAASASPAHLAELLIGITSEGGARPPGTVVADLADDDTPTLASASSGGRGRLYYRQVAHWVADAAEALHYAHGQGIIHRDIKPANLILSVDGRIMVADFGLAKSVDEESVTLTGSLLGTVRYLSPEQAMARRIPVDHRTDIYSLGATMYELLCFQAAFPGSDDKQVLSAIITREPASPRKIAPVVPHELETICLKALEKSPDARYGTAHEFAEDLRRFTHDLPIIAKRPGPIARTIKFVRRHKVPVAAALIIATLATTAGVVVRMERERRWTEVARRREADRLKHEAELETLVHGALAQQETNRDEAIRLYEEVLRLDRNHVRALNNVAGLLKDRYNSQPRGDRALLERAMAYCDRALDLPPSSHPYRPNLQNLKGVLLKMLGHYDEAIELYQRSIALDPNYYAAWENLGVIYALKGDLAKADRHLKRATELADPDQDECERPWRSLASLQLFRGQKEAVQSIRQASACNRLDPWSALIAARLRLDFDGYVDLEAGLDQAKFANRALKDKNAVFRQLARRMLALAYLRNERFAKAVELAGLALEAGDMAAIDHLITAVAQARLRDFAQAREALEQAARQWPDDLRAPGEHRPTAPEGVLWFETADELIRLRSEADRLIAGTTP